MVARTPTLPSIRRSLSTRLLRRSLSTRLLRLLGFPLLVIFLLSLGCGGHGGGTGLPAFVEGSVTDAEFDAAAAAISQAFQDAGSGEDVSDSVLEAMRAQPKVVGPTQSRTGSAEFLQPASGLVPGWA